MFQLIVSVISIALFVALAIASIPYIGDAFTRSSERANVTTLVNQGTQISGAYHLSRTDNGGGQPTVASLVTGNYLSTEPTPSQIATGDWSIVYTAGEPAVAVVQFAADADVASLCAEGGEVEKQNGACVTADGTAPADEAAATHFGSRL